MTRIGQGTMVLALLLATPSITGAQARPYALPFQLRPAIAPNVLRIESSFGVGAGGLRRRRARRAERTGRVR